MTIGIANDHAGYELKLKLLEYFQQKGIAYKDFGADTSESVDYADFAHIVASAVENKQVDLGFSICGSGNGISMTLNKHKGIRAALCWKPEIAALARQHNNANVLSLPARFVTESEALYMVEVFFMSQFEGGRHQTRIDKMSKLD